jgi:hypothetical protein
LSSCQKKDEYLDTEFAKGKHIDGNAKSIGELKKCSILQIIYPVPGGTTDVLQFMYNSSGDPLSIKRNSGGHTGYPNYDFKYDQKKKLTDFVGPYNSTTAEFWHKYFYDGYGNIVLDSTYIFPTIVNGFPENAYDRRLTFYTYDVYNRIIKDSTVSASAPPVVHTYAYDANGNKTGRSYDGNTNINRTNSIWMFLNRDYSVNNPFNADAYNTSGLPTNFNLSQENAFGFLGNVYSVGQIIYSCDSQTAK